MIKWSTEYEVIATLNLCVSNNIASRYIKQKLTVERGNKHIQA